MNLTNLRLPARGLLAVAAITGLLALTPAQNSRAADANPFDVLLGSWGGKGEYTLADGRSERMQCSAYYTGGGSTLGMAILCKSPSSSIQIRSKLNKSGNRISGTWEERTYNAGGNASGQVSGDRISLQISGGVAGSMSVSYTKARQSVSISTQGPLRSVKVDLGRS